ncbi:MAG: sulfatase-like hydrolase/transferase [Spirochaetia bacterium]|nr:sulfatase-like hydrolase/transferase [Spirochaetia bacterium]
MDYAIASQKADDFNSLTHPNVLVIITDQQQKQTIDFYGGKLYSTTGINRLAAEGMIFDRAYTTCPLSAPARASLLSGLPICRTGVPVNDDDARIIALEDSVATFGDVFKQAGYKCGYFGKWHIGREEFPQHGFTDGWFVHLRNSYENWLEREGLFTFPDDVTGLNRRGLVPYELAHDTVSTDKAIEFISNNHAEPFLCVCSLRAPHDPYIGPFDNEIDFHDIPLPESYSDDLSTKPYHQRTSWGRKIAESMGIDDETTLKKVTANYLGLVKLVDKNIDRLLDTLDQNQLKEDTIVMFLSDHGDMMGAHGLMMKGPFMYEETTNIPFVIRYPGVIQQGRCSELVSMADFAPTLLEYAGLPVPSAMEGISLKQLIEQKKTQKSTAWRDYVIIESYESYSLRCPIWNITTENWKYNHYFGDIDELYHVHEDPHEMHNLAQDSAYRNVLYHHREKLIDWGNRKKSFNLTELLELSKHCITPGIEFQEVLSGSSNQE